jgi:hypothetical protein
MIDGRLSIYFSPEDRKVMEKIFSTHIGSDGKFRSEAEFIRYCIRFTVENDKELNGKKTR